MWTKWIKLTDLEYKYNDTTIHKHFYYDSPAVYELAIGGPRMGSLEISYVGITDNFRRRMNQHASGYSNISKKIDDACNNGKTIYCRFSKRNTRDIVLEIEKNFLKNYSYSWNIIGNQKRIKQIKIFRL